MGDRWLDEYIDKRRRSAKRALCPKCGTRTLVGDDHDAMALRVRVDATPIDRLREIVARLRGVAAYDLVPRGDGAGDLYYREDWHVMSRRQKYPVHLEHRCPDDREKH